MKYSLHYSFVCYIFDFKSFVCLLYIQFWIICLFIVYLILNYLFICHIFNFELSVYLLNIWFWIICLFVKYSILNYLSVYQTFDFELSVYIENTVLFCLKNASKMQCFFTLKIHRKCSAFLSWKCIENAVRFWFEKSRTSLFTISICRFRWNLK